MSLPGGAELARRLADESSFPSRDKRDRSDLIKVASFYQWAGDRDRLLHQLHEVFVQEPPWGKIHDFLAAFPQDLFIVTTNYDDLVERAFQAHQKPFHLVVHCTEPSHRNSVQWWEPHAEQPRYCTPSELPLRPGKDGTIIYKMHGTVSRVRPEFDSFVITEDDYIDFLARMIAGSGVPARFGVHFRHARFLYLGYGLADWNLRVMIRNLKPEARAALAARVSRGHAADGMHALREVGIGPDADAAAELSDESPHKSWAIQSRPSELESSLWEARHVKIFPMTVNEFVDGLTRELAEQAKKNRGPER